MLIDYLRFRAFAAPLLIEVMFWLAVAGGIVGTALAVISGATVAWRESVLIGLLIAVPSLLALPVWIIAVRIACEGAIVVFRIHEELRDGDAGEA